jgi:hypothetical protein
MVTHEFLDDVKHFIAMGWSTARIARALGVTRNTVIGRASRGGVRLNSQSHMLHAFYANNPRVGREAAQKRAKLGVTRGAGAKVKESRARPPRRKKKIEATPPRVFVHRKPGRIMFLLGIGAPV